MLLSLVYFVKVINNRDIMDFFQKVRNVMGLFFYYPKTGGLCTSNQSRYGSRKCFSF